MKNRRTQVRIAPAFEGSSTVSVQLPIPLVETLRVAQADLTHLCTQVGLSVFDAMLEADRVRLCGPAHRPDPTRRAVRAGTTPSEVTLGGRRVSVRRPRVRSLQDGEVTLPSFAWARDRDPLDAATVERVAAGVTTRSYARTLDPLPDGLDERATSHSAVSRRFVALSTERLSEWLARPLGELDLWAILIDGIFLTDHVVLIALGLARDGRKHVLGLWEGTTERTEVARALLRNLLDRGLPEDRALLFVIDGGRGIRRAIRDLFGPRARVQRCQVHKSRNVLEHLPEEMHGSVRRAMRQAWDLTDPKKARRCLENLARSLDADHPGAAASLREGLDETLTLVELGVRGSLYRTLRSTNPIENLNSSVERFTRNVKRWRDGRMIVRWVGAAVVDAQERFRRVRGYKDMGHLVAALQASASPKKDHALDTMRKAA